MTIKRNHRLRNSFFDITIITVVNVAFLVILVIVVLSNIVNPHINIMFQRPG